MKAKLLKKKLKPFNKKFKVSGDKSFQYRWVAIFFSSKGVSKVLHQIY